MGTITPPVPEPPKLSIWDKIKTVLALLYSILAKGHDLGLYDKDGNKLS